MGAGVAAGAQGFAELQAVHAGHHEIEHQQIVGRFGVQRQGAETVAGLAHGVARGAQVEHQQVSDVGLVFGHQDAFGRVHGRWVW